MSYFDSRFTAEQREAIRLSHLTGGFCQVQHERGVRNIPDDGNAVFIVSAADEPDADGRQDEGHLSASTEEAREQQLIRHLLYVAQRYITSAKEVAYRTRRPLPIVPDVPKEYYLRRLA